MCKGVVHFFSKPLLDGWVYPCTLEEIETQLKLVPDEDLEGLWAVGLAPSTKKDCSANGRYRKNVKATITLYSYAATLTYRQPARTKRSEIEHWQQIELAYGMRVREEGSRWVCQWQAEDLPRSAESPALQRAGWIARLPSEEDKSNSSGWCLAIGRTPAVQCGTSEGDGFAMR